MTKKSSITQKDVANFAGVSRSVVSYVINDGPRDVAPETKERVLKAIKELDYQPNKYAQRLKLGDAEAKKCLGIIAGGKSYNVLERPYYNIILAGLFDEAHQMGLDVRFFSFFDALLDPVFFSRNIHPDEISALILILPSMVSQNPEYVEILDQIDERIENVVCLEESIKSWPAVVFDRANAARIAVEHLLKLGHEQIAFLAITDNRLDGYRQALVEHGVNFDPNLVFEIYPSQVLNSAYELTQRIIEMEPRPSAIFAANDESAISAMAALHDRGIKVPEEMAIVSIDNIGLAEMVRPGLTTVNVPKRQMAKCAVQFLMMQKQFNNQHPASIVFPTELIIRDSCGANLEKD
jgi:DNA-binding LacI/PurR family transcriptional regulator